MKLYFGGAYNGKLQYIKENYNIKDKEIFNCSEGEIDFSKKVINSLHKFIYYNIQNEIDSLDFIKNNIDNFKNKIIICDEICQGIVPLKKEDRKWREETGKVLQYLSKESTLVCRIFFGINQVLKEE